MSNLNLVWQTELEFLGQLKDDINMQIRSYAPLDKVRNYDDGNDFKDSVMQLTWIRNKLKKRVDALRAQSKEKTNK